MKKLVIAAAIVCAAVFAKAASVTWTASNIYAGSSTTKIADGCVYYAFGGDYTKASIIAALEGKGADAVNEWLGDVTKATGTTSSAKASQSTAQDVTVVGIDADGNKHNLYLLVFDSASITDTSKFFVAEKEATVAASGNTAFAFGAQGNTKTWDGASQVAGAWHAVNVPEPTSGLLLVLGMAGLALRRRRA